jgi:plasmid stability protein
MIRTQVYLTEEQARDIKIRAKREGRHEAEVIRELLSEGLKTSQPKQKISTGESLLRLVRIGAKGQADLSSRIDDILYGEDR